MEILMKNWTISTKKSGPFSQVGVLKSPQYPLGQKVHHGTKFGNRIGSVISIFHRNMIPEPIIVAPKGCDKLLEAENCE